METPDTEPTNQTKTAKQIVQQTSAPTAAPAHTPDDQLTAAFLNSQQLGIELAQTWVKAISELPVMELFKIPEFPNLPDLEAATRYTFEVAADLLNAEREFAVQLTNTLLTFQLPNASALAKTDA